VVLAVPRGEDVPVEPAGDDPGMEEIRAWTARAGVAAEAPPRTATAVVIDVLRATSTLTAALGNGAAGVLVAGTVAEARALARSHPGVVLCGERFGRIIEGFDLGNSPLEYTSVRVGGKSMVFASTNGSQALRYASGARRVLAGAFVNAGAVAEAVRGDAEVWLVASGKAGEPAIEDVACAGWIARALGARGFAPRGEEARLAIDVAPRDATGVRSLVEGCSHARLLGALGPGFVRDCEWCATLDRIAAAFEIGAA